MPEFTHMSLKEKLNNADDDAVESYLKTLLKEFEKEGQLRKVFMTLFEDDPKEILLKLTDVSDFKMAKFGALKKVEKIIQNKEKPAL